MSYGEDTKWLKTSHTRTRVCIYGTMVEHGFNTSSQESPPAACEIISMAIEQTEA